MTASLSAVRSSLLEGIVELERYPIDRLDGPTGRQLVEHCRDQLAHDGCAVLKNFVPRESLERLERETGELWSKATFIHGKTNPYNSNGDPRLPREHPMNRFDDRTNGFVAGDHIGESTIIRKLYRDPRFQGFISSVVDLEEIHPYADPLADLVVNVLREGCQHPWHYDTNEFIVTLLTRKPEAGGRFEYVPELRSPKNENFDSVRAVLDGDRSGVKSLELELGDLQIFLGRYSLHRVTPVQGKRQRHSVIFAYAKDPGFVGKPERAQRIFGRMAPVHEKIMQESIPRSDNLAD